MKETISPIHRFTDLTSQFFTYVSKEGDEILFSRTMLNFEGYREIKNIREASILMFNECYFSHFELDGVLIFKISGYLVNGEHIGNGLMGSFSHIGVMISPWYPSKGCDGPEVEEGLSRAIYEHAKQKSRAAFLNTKIELTEDQVEDNPKPTNITRDKLITSAIISGSLCLTLWYALYGVK